jgi:hypothetical protein
VNQKFGTATRHEHPGAHRDPQTAEVRPTEDVFERLSGGSPVDHGGEVVHGVSRGHQESGFVLGENTPGGSQPGDDDGTRINGLEG